MLLTIGNTSMNTDDNMDMLARIHREFVAAGIAETEMFRKTAKNCSDMDSLLRLFEKECGNVQNRSTQQACRILFDMKIFDVSNQIFLKKYRTAYMNVDSYIVPVVDALTDILEMDQAYKDRKAIEKANRGHWEGGGFGVAGALKGAVTASAMNLAGSAVHGVFDLASSTMQSAKVSSRKSKIFKDPQTIYFFSIALLKAYMGGFHGVCDELYSHGFSSANEVKPDNAIALSQNTIQYSSDKKQEAELLAKSIFMNPFDVNLYVQFLHRHPKKRGFQNVQQHFGIDKLLQYQTSLKNEAETKKILMQPAYTIEEKCKQLAELTRLAEGTDVQAGHPIYAVLEQISNQCHDDLDKINYAIMQLNGLRGSKYGADIQFTIDSLIMRKREIEIAEAKIPISRMPENNDEACRAKLDALIQFGEANACDVGEDSFRVLKLYLEKAENLQKIRDLYEDISLFPISKISGNSSMKHALSCKMDILQHESDSGCFDAPFFSPVIFDAIEKARKGNTVCQVWLIHQLCPDECLKNSILSSENRFKISFQYHEKLEDVILYFFDQPQRYAFDMYMRLRLNLQYESAKSYCKSLMSIIGNANCPAASYDFGRYAVALKLHHPSKAIPYIEFAAQCGYAPAWKYLLERYNTYEKSIKFPKWFYEVLGTRTGFFQNCEEVYKSFYGMYGQEHSFQHEIEIIFKIIHGEYAWNGSNLKTICLLLQSVWEEMYAHQFCIRKPRIGFMTNDDSRKELKRIIKQYKIPLEEECPLMAFCYQEPVHDKTILFVLTDRGGFWNQGSHLYYVSYQGCADKPYITIPARRLDMAWPLLIQSFEFIMRSLCMGDISNGHIANKQAMCGKPLGISKLLLSDDIGKEKREILRKIKDQQTGSGKYLDRCPQCFAKLNPGDKYCPDCGRKTEENTV